MGKFNFCVFDCFKYLIVSFLLLQSLNVFVFLSPNVEAGNNHQFENYQNINFSDLKLVDRISKKCMETLHDKVDGDDDGKISISEGAQFIRDEDFKKSSGKNLPGFETDKDGIITQREFWDTWARSSVHNWTVDQMVDWFNTHLKMPQFSKNLIKYGISGCALPILATDKSLASALVDKSAEHRMRLQFKALELILGYSPNNNLLKDILVSISLIMACSGIMFGFYAHKKSSESMKEMEERLKTLQDQVDEDGMVWMNISSDERHSMKDSDEHSVDSDASLQTQIEELQDELNKTKACLEELRSNSGLHLPPKLLIYLKETYNSEYKHLTRQHTEATNRVQKAQAQFLKVNKKWAVFSTVPLISSRQSDKFDGELNLASEALKTFHSTAHEFRKRWLKMESVCKHRFFTSQSKSSAKIQIATISSSSLPLRDPIIRSQTVEDTINNDEKLHKLTKSSNSSPLLVHSGFDSKKNPAHSLKREKPKGKIQIRQLGRRSKSLTPEDTPANLLRHNNSSPKISSKIRPPSEIVTRQPAPPVAKKDSLRKATTPPSGENSKSKSLESLNEASNRDEEPEDDESRKSRRKNPKLPAKLRLFSKKK